ncbi:Acetone carboxylase alpha subunit [Brevibacterium casei]|uniref:Acetone carboxylase alpha subunit n=2 Tax=Brevibacterium casei TaxID=33889 RepID=A0A449D981_9MICO|nr:Acetone carboxylase alpha subunit [Brevibacterium casei]
MNTHTAARDSDGTAHPVDPITFEVVRNRLTAITEEQAITLKAVSGSPVVTDATDFNVGTYLPGGEIVTMGPQVLFHSGSMASVVRSIVAEAAENPGIADGDMFILNNPYRGALHQQDVSIVAPVFDHGEHVAWVGCCAHQIDMGGRNFGSWGIGARSVQEEAVLMSGVKLVEGGEIREDIWDMILGMTRMPLAVGLDLKAMIAANTVASRRLGALFDRYGLDVVRSVMRLEIDHAEEQLRSRLRSLPDGTFRGVDYLEHDGLENTLYEVRVEVRKTGDRLVVDFSGTSPQAPGFINCTWSGMLAGVFTALLPTLATTLRWNEGLLRVIEIEAPDGLVCNATFPAPVSAATISTMWVVMNAAVQALSRLAATSPEFLPDAVAVTKGSMTAFVINGTNRDGSPYGNFLLDSTAGGGGAYFDHDGLNGSGDFCVPRPAITNIEAHEAAGPILFLYRSILPDTGGAGRFRGGATTGLAITPHDAESLQGMIVGHGVEVPNSVGLFGGLEGSCNVNMKLHADGKSPVGRISGADDLAAWQGRTEDLGPKPGFFPIAAGDVIAYSFQGGGGLGDPLDREPTSVSADVTAGYVSAQAASDLYGVVIVDGVVDETATQARRETIRLARLTDASVTAEDAVEPTVGTAPSDGDDAVWLSPDVYQVEGVVRTRAGAVLGTSDDWVGGTLRRVVPAAEHGRGIRLHEDLELREYLCPTSGRLLWSAVSRRDAPDLVPVELS